MLILIALLAASADYRIEAIQHRGWWEIRYPDGTVAANEIHIPARRSVTIDVTLDGAGIFVLGAIPRFGRHASVTVNRSSTGTALHVTEPRASHLTVIADVAFDAWLKQQRSPAPSVASAGRNIFLTARCTLCHTVRGVAQAETDAGPDLTHLATRKMIAGTLPNRIGYLAGWIVDPDALKRGSGMPGNNIHSADLQSLLAFLQTLR